MLSCTCLPVSMHQKCRLGLADGCDRNLIDAATRHFRPGPLANAMSDAESAPSSSKDHAAGSAPSSSSTARHERSDSAAGLVRGSVGRQKVQTKPRACSAPAGRPADAKRSVRAGRLGRYQHLQLGQAQARPLGARHARAQGWREEDRLDGAEATFGRGSSAQSVMGRLWARLTGVQPIAGSWGRRICSSTSRTRCSRRGRSITSGITRIRRRASGACRRSGSATICPAGG